MSGNSGSSGNNVWGNIFESARERTAAVLERTGDALTDFATDHVAKQGQQGQQRGDEGGTDGGTKTESISFDTTASTKDSETTARATIAPIPSSRADGTDGAKKKREEEGRAAAPPPSQQPNNRFAGWGSGILGATRSALENTRQTLQNAGAAQSASQSAGLFLSRSKSNESHPQKRDISLPLDTASLRDAEVVYITDRLITMGHPALQSPTDGDITPSRKLAAVAQLLAKRHQGRYMVWNLSEVEYDYSIMDDQVLAYQFPGSPSPPLGLLLKLIFSMESWLKADARNVAVVHCLTGKGRTSTVLACFLCWMGEAGFHDPMRALEYIALCKRCDVDQLTIPSQRRYVSYFGNMLDGVRPHHPPLLLKRLIMSEAPKYEKPPKSVERNSTDGSRGVDSTPQLGCSPYVQIFKGGQLIFTTAASMSYAQEKDELPFCLPSDGSISFPIETVVQGDILIRCRHLTQRGKRVSMFRAAFHTGYTPARVLRLGKAQLDGACTDKRFGDDFFIDLVFEACDAATASKHLLSLSSRDLSSAKEKQEEVSEKDTSAVKGGGDGTTAGTGTTEQSAAALQEVTHNTAAARRARATLGASGGSDNPQAAVTASTYDSMLHRDARFWNVIGSRRQENMSKLEEEHSEKAGPTIGRRRDASAMMLRNKKEEGSAGSEGGQKVDSGEDSQKITQESAENNIKQAMQSFSIGFGIDFDFAQDDGDQVQGNGGEPERVPPPQTPPKRDELMEALMALDDDVGSPPSSFNVGAPAEEQEIVFEDEGAVKENEAKAPDMGDTRSPEDDKCVESDLPSEEFNTDAESAYDKSASTEMSVGNQPELEQSEGDKKESSVNDQLGGSNDAMEQGDSTSPSENKGEEALPTGPESTTVEVVEPSSPDAFETESDSKIGDSYNVGTAPDVSVDEKLDADVDVDAAADVDVDVDDFDFDDDDAELDDLENFLMKSGK